MSPLLICLNRYSEATQAIARSHRYGQTKTCLVFKLMVKASAEGLWVAGAFCMSDIFKRLRTNHSNWQKEDGP